MRNKILIAVCIFTLGGLLGFTSTKKSDRVIEAEKIVLVSKNGKMVMEMRVDDNKPVIALCDEKGKARLSLEGGDSPGIVIRNQSEKVVAQVRDFKEDGSGFVLYDSKGSKRIQCQGGELPGLFVLNDDKKVIANLSASKAGHASFALRNADETPEVVLKGGKTPSLAFYEGEQSQMELIASKHGPLVKLNDLQGSPLVQLQGGTSAGVFLRQGSGEVVGSLIPLKEGGSALGLTNSKGDVATLLRGGNNPSVSFFQKNDSADVVLGISDKAPHLLLSKTNAAEGLLLYGGSPSSMLFVNERGQVPVILSKHGLLQDRNASAKEKPAPKKERFYSWEEFKDPLEDLESFKR